MVEVLVTASVVILALIAELIHARRCSKLAALAFGDRRRPFPWASAAPLIRVASLGIVAWGMSTLMLLPPKTHKAATVEEGQEKHILMVLDVSPSMRLEDAGPKKDEARNKRASELMESFFRRVPMEQYRVTVVATYTDAKPVFIDTRDIEVVRNVMSDLPMHQAFESGETRLFSGLEEAVKIAKPWKPRSTNLVMISDGDTVPSKGMPKMPPSIAKVLVIGVGDPRKGTFIDGRQSRQDTSTLRQIATRLRGTYHNGNEKHISSETLAMLTRATGANDLEKLTKREYAIIALAVGSAAYALLIPLMLHLFGHAWSPGVRTFTGNLTEKTEETVSVS